MQLGESPVVFFSGAGLIQHTRQHNSVDIPESEAKGHFVGRLSSDYDIQRGMLLPVPKIDTATLDVR